MKLFLILLVPECVFMLYCLSQNGLFMLINTPSILFSIAANGGILPILSLVLFAAGCVAAAFRSAHHVGFIPQLLISFILSLPLTILTLFMDSCSFQQALIRLVLDPLMYTSAIFPAVCLGSVICMLVLQPVVRILTHSRSKFRVILHKQSRVLLTLITCLFGTAALSSYAEAFHLTNIAQSLPVGAARYLSRLSMMPGDDYIRHFLSVIPLLPRIIVLTLCAVTSCLWQFNSVRTGLRQTAGIPRSPSVASVRPIASSSVRQVTARPVAPMGRPVSPHAVMHGASRSQTYSTSTAQPVLPRRSAASREQAMLDAMERTVRSGGVAGLNTRTGCASV